MEEINRVFKSAPILVLLAMNPATLNSEVPNKYMPMNDQELTEVVAPIPAAEVSTIDFREAQASQQSYPLGWAYFQDRTIREIVPTIGGKRQAYFVLLGSGSDASNKDVYSVYYVDAESKDDNLHHYPPLVKGLVYHNLGEGKEFLGVKLEERLYHDKNSPNRMTGIMYSEVKLYDEKSAQYMLDLLTNDTKWNNKTNIGYSETTSPRVMVPEVY